MENKTLLKLGVITLIIVATVVAFWEISLRNKGAQASYDDGSPLWADKRAMVYEPVEETVVFIGSCATPKYCMLIIKCRGGR